MTASCLLCTSNFTSDKLINIDEWLVNETSCLEVIQTHFSFYEKILAARPNSNSICPICWSRLKTFHEFYTSVSINYGIIDEIKEEDKDCLDWDELIEESHEENVEYEFEEVEALEEVLADPLVDNNSQVIIKTQRIIPKVINTVYKTDHFRQRRPTAGKIDPEDDVKIRQTANMFCELCGHHLQSFSHARSHYRTEHNTIGYLICCGKKFKQRNRLVDHMNHHFNVSYPCFVCSKVFDAKSYLVRHMACHDDQKAFECDLCSKKFAKKFLIRNHMQGVHRYQNMPPSYECPMDDCIKVFINEARLKHHLKYTHSKLDQEACGICLKTFKTKAAVEEHLKIHYRRPEDRFKCDICGHYIADLKSFKRHLKNHETEGQDNTCHYCGKKSPNLNALKKHISFVHEKVKCYQCRYCERSFKRPRTLIDHEAAVHTLQELYSCSFCPKTFRNQSNMLAHRKKSHPDQYQKPAYMRDVV